VKVTILKDVLIAKGQIDRYFEGATPVNLWRALNVKADRHLFDFVEEPFVLSNGQPRPADITIETIAGHKWVRVTERPRGISTFDKPGVPRGKDWVYYRIPAGTELRDGLAIVRDELNSRFGATHYTIAPAFDMPIERFRLLLNQLVQKVIREAV
jgi:hypothetical protein